MLDFIIQYWVGWLFGIVAAGVAVLAKHYRKLYLSEKNHQKTEEQKAFYDGILDKISEETGKMLDEVKIDMDRHQLNNKKHDEILQEQINTLDTNVNEIKDDIRTLTNGLSSVQGMNFRDKCRKYLNSEYSIHDNEYEQLTHDYEIYKSLGMNGTGDALYKSIQDKYLSDNYNIKRKEETNKD